MNDWEIIKKAFEFTKNHKYLWFFGFLLSGVSPIFWVFPEYFEINSFYAIWLGFKGLLPDLRVLWCFYGLMFCVSWLLLNWSNDKRRLIIKLTVEKYFKKTEGEHNLELPSFEKASFKMSLIGLVSGLMFFSFLVFVLLPKIWFKEYGQYSDFLATWGFVFVVAVGFMFSIINICGILYSVVYGFGVKKSLGLAVEFLVNNMNKILKWAGFLFVINGVLGVVGLGLSGVFLGFFQVFVGGDWSGQLGHYWFLGGVRFILLWIIFSIYSIFFHVVVGLVFLQSNGHISTLKKESRAVSSYGRATL